jgi:hypothetical protein
MTTVSLADVAKHTPKADAALDRLFALDSQQQRVASLLRDLLSPAR